MKSSPDTMLWLQCLPCGDRDWEETRYRPLLVSQWPGAKIWASDRPPRPCWEAKIIQTLIILICLMVWEDWPSLMAQMVKNLPTMLETWVQSPGQEDPPEEEKIIGEYPTKLQQHLWNCCLYQLSPLGSVFWREEQEYGVSPGINQPPETTPHTSSYPMFSDLKQKSGVLELGSHIN